MIEATHRSSGPAGFGASATVVGVLPSVTASLGGSSTAVRLATDCGPVPCWIAFLVAWTIGATLFGCLEFVGYLIVRSTFDENAARRRAAFRYVTALNILLVPLLATAVYSLFP